MVSIITKPKFQPQEKVIHSATKEIGTIKEIIDDNYLVVKYNEYRIPHVECISVIKHLNLFPCSND